MTTFKPRRGASEETNAADTLILEVYLQDGEEAIFCFLSHTAYGTLLQQPWQNSIVSTSLLLRVLASRCKKRRWKVDVCGTSLV